MAFFLKKENNSTFIVPPKFCVSIIFNLSWGDCKSQEKLKTMLVQDFEGTTKSIMVFLKKGLHHEKKTRINYKNLASSHYCLNLFPKQQRPCPDGTERLDYLISPPT